MAKIFIGIALVVTLATAVLGFLANGNIKTLQGEKIAAKTAQNKAEGDLHVKVGELKKAGEDVAAAKSALDEKEKELAAKTSEVGDLNKKVAEAKAEADKAKADLAAMPNTPKPDGPAVVDLAPQLAEAKMKLGEAEQKLAEATQIQETLNRKVKENESRLAALEQYKRSREFEIMRPGVSGRVLAVNSGWNFVVLSIGDKQGLLNNSPLLVTRGGEPIAKVRVTSIETSTSIADVIPGSVRKGVTVQPGDNVVFEGTRNQSPKGQMPAGAPPAAAEPVKVPATELPKP